MRRLSDWPLNASGAIPYRPQLALHTCWPEIREVSPDSHEKRDSHEERLIQIGWITGFVDGEGCFSINFIRQPDRQNRKGYRTGYQVAHEFAVTQGAKSIDCLHMLKDFFGVGDVYVNRRYDNHREHLHRYVVRKRSDLLNTINPFFSKYPLLTSKRTDFLKFQDCLDRIDRNDHLNAIGLAKIVRIAETMNHCKLRSQILRDLHLVKLVMEFDNVAS